MSRYVFFNSDAQDAKVLTVAKKTARSRGATVVKSLAGTMLLEATPAQLPQVAQALLGWRYSVERKTPGCPSPSPWSAPRRAARWQRPPRARFRPHGVRIRTATPRFAPLRVQI